MVQGVRMVLLPLSLPSSIVQMRSCLILKETTFIGRFSQRGLIGIGELSWWAKRRSADAQKKIIG